MDDVIRRHCKRGGRLVKILERPVGQQVAPFQGLLESGIGTCQQLWDTRELHLVSLDYGGETREVGAIDINIDQDLVA